MTENNVFDWKQWLPMLDRDSTAKVAIEALVDIGIEALPALIDILKSPANRAEFENVGEILVRIGEPSVEPLIQLLHNGDIGAAWLLGQLRSQAAVQPLIAALQSKNKWLRWTAIVALETIGSAECVPALEAKLRDRSSTVRFAAIEALCALGEPTSIGALTLLSSRTKDTGIMAAAEQAINAINRRFGTGEP